MNDKRSQDQLMQVLRIVLIIALAIGALYVIDAIQT